MNPEHLVIATSLLMMAWIAPAGALTPSNPYAIGQFYQGLGPAILYNSTSLVTRINYPTIVGSQKNIVIIGDSIPSNSAPTLYTVTQANNFNGNISDGAIYKSSDPILGTTSGFASPFLSSVCGPLGDSLITGSYCTNAIVWPNGMGSSVVANWASGGALNQNIVVLSQRMANLGITPDAWIWHAGPNDTNLGTSQASYTASLASVIATIRVYWPSVPILVGVCTQANGVQSVPIQNAQIAAVNHPSGIWAGVNSDAFPGGDFQDGTHFNATGRAAWVSSAITQLHAAGAI